MADAKSGGHGHGGTGFAGKMLIAAIAAIGFVIAYNGMLNVSERKPVFDGIAAPQSQFQGAITNTPRVGYIQGAPTSPQECLRRGGTDLGRGCYGYR